MKKQIHSEELRSRFFYILNGNDILVVSYIDGILYNDLIHLLKFRWDLLHDKT